MNNEKISIIDTYCDDENIIGGEIIVFDSDKIIDKFTFIFSNIYDFF